MKSRLLFIVPSFENGGTITSLSNLLPLIDSDRYNIDVFAITPSGSNMQKLKLYSTVLGASPTVTSDKQMAKIFGLSVKITRIIKKVLCYFHIDISPLTFKIIARQFNKKKYDCIISYQEGQATLLGSYLKAPYKIAWLHCEAYRLLQKISLKKLNKTYELFDKIICVSNTASKDFNSLFPTLAEKTFTVYNSLDPEQVKIRASESIETIPNCFKIVSVGRIDPVKRFSKIPEMAHNLKLKGINFLWFIIGGPAVPKEYNLIRNLIHKYGVADCVRILGQKDNPYPYIKNSDLLVCLSISETFNYTISEAKALGVPVVTTDFASALEFVENEKQGFVTNIDKIESVIEDLIKNPLLIQSIKDNLSNQENLSDITKVHIKSLFELCERLRV